MSLIFDDTLLIHTNRLLRRKFYQSDIHSMLKNWISDSDVQSGYGEPVYTNEDDISNLLNSWEGQYRWAIILKDTDESIGHISFCRVYEDINIAEVEYCVGKAFWGKGIVSEALSAFIKHTFLNTSIAKLEAFHKVENLGSGRVLEKAGLYRAENIVRFAHFSKAPDEDICYSISK